MQRTAVTTKTLTIQAIDRAAHLPPNLMRAIGLVTIVAVGVVDRLTGPEISFSLFYVIPIAFVTWYGKLWFGVLCAVISTGLVMWEELVWLTDLSTFIQVWNTFARLLNFCAVAVVFNYVHKLYHARLKHVQDKYTSIVESAIEGIIATDLQGTVQFVNVRAASMLGYPFRSIIGNQVFDFIADQPSQQAIQNVLHSGRQTDNPLEIQFSHTSGTPVWVLVNATESKDDLGNVDGMVLLLTDFSERKIAEEALRESEQNYRILVERMKEGLVRVDDEDRIQFVNQEFCELVGYPKEELLGQVASEMFLSEDGRAFLKEKNALRLRGVADIYEVQLQTKSGSVIWVRVSGAPVWDSSGSIVGSIGVHTDITLQKIADEELRRRYEEISAMQRMSSVLAQSMDLGKRLQSALDTVLDVLQYDGGTIFMFDEAGKELVLKHHRGLSDEVVHRTQRWPADLGMIGRVARTSKAAFVADARESSEIDPGIREMVRLLALGDVPLESKGKVLGVMTVFLQRPHTFSENEKAILQTFGKQIGIALENANLYEMAKDREKQVRRLSIELVKVQEDERKRFARELHDGLSQVLTTLKINTDLASKNFQSNPSEAERHLREALNLADEAQNEAKQLAYDLRPAILDDFGLKAAIAVLVTNFERRTGISTEFISPIPDIRFDSLFETSVYRIVQELLTNVAKHAIASRISIQLLIRHDTLVLEVTDNGRGLVLGTAAANAKGGTHFGLRNIRERIEFFGGVFRTESFENRGTEVMIELPASQFILPLNKQAVGG